MTDKILNLNNNNDNIIKWYILDEERWMILYGRYIKTLNEKWKMINNRRSDKWWGWSTNGDRR